MGDVAGLNFQVGLALATGGALLAAAVLAAVFYYLGGLYESPALSLAPPAVEAGWNLAPTAPVAADVRPIASPTVLPGPPVLPPYGGRNLDGAPYAPPVVAALVLVVVLSTPDPPPQTEGSGPDDQAQFTPNKEEPPYPNLVSHFSGLVASVESGQATARDAARGAGIHQDESIAPTIGLSGRADAVDRSLVAKGLDPRNVGEDWIESYVPVTLLGQVSELPGVLWVRESVPPNPPAHLSPADPPVPEPDGMPPRQRWAIAKPLRS